MKAFRNTFLRLILSVPVAGLWAGPAYVIDRVDFPGDLPPEVGAVDFDSEGTLYVALRRGDILTAKPVKDAKAFKWKAFASGFHNACGIHIIKPGHVVIGQMAELTEVIDENGDGVADEYRNLSTDFGLSGNYHETMDICPDGKDGYYLAPGTASHNGPTFGTPRGPYSKIGRYGRNYSAVQYRGWVLHWSPEKGITPISSGYRMHNGIERAPNGTLWCGDNQGDWRAASPVYHVTQDSFMGHPSALVWDDRFASVKNPLYLPRILLDDLWNKPAFHLPHGMIRSVTEPAFDTTGGAFGPFEGQMFVGDQSGQAILRLIPEMVDGAYQGAAINFFRGNGLGRGNNRLVFSPEGDTLYVGQTGRGWGNLSEGLQRIRFSGEMPFDLKDCSLTRDGFKLVFTKPVDPASLTADSIKVERYRYEYSYRYGSPERDKAPVTVKLSIAEGQPDTVMLVADKLVPNFIYRLNIKTKAVDGASFDKGPVIYTLNRLRRPQSEHKITITNQNDEKMRVEIDGTLFTEYHLKGFSNPILYPILNPDGTGMTRDWPINEDGRKGEEKDHPHHKALFIGHQGQNGVDFWHGGRKGAGTTRHARILDVRSGQDRAALKTFNLWEDSEGKVLCSDTRELQFSVVNGARVIDLELNMHASHGDLTFQEYKDGFVGLRTHPHLRLTAKPAKGVTDVFGKARNSAGDEGKAIWGKRADWVHYFGKADGKPAGIAFMAHPDNPRSPTWWHARDYGLVAANPFGPKKNGADGEFVLPEGQTLTLRYRFVFHNQDGAAVDIAGQFDQFRKSAREPRTVVSPIPDGVFQ